MGKINDMWNEYEVRVIPAGAGRYQRVATKKAFWAGIIALHKLMVVDVTALSDDQAEKLLESFDNEIQDYLRELAAELKIYKKESEN